MSRDPKICTRWGDTASHAVVLFDIPRFKQKMENNKKSSVLEQKETNEKVRYRSTPLFYFLIEGIFIISLDYV